MEVGDGLFFDMRTDQRAASRLLSRSKFGFPSSYTPPAKIFSDITPRNVSRIGLTMALTQRDGVAEKHLVIPEQLRK